MLISHLVKRHIYHIALLVSIVCLTNLLILIQHFARAVKPGLQSLDAEFTFAGHNFPMTLPLADLDLVHLTIEESNKFPLLGNDSDPIWSGITSTGSGYVRMGPDYQIYMVSMFHQIHCLRALNFAYGGSVWATPEHIHHCLAYLRQMALCGADATLEVGDFTKRDFEVERTGETHVCRDWSAVYSAMTAMQDNWDRRQT